VYLVAGELYKGVTSETYKKDRPTIYTYTPQNPDIEPQHTLRAVLHDPENGDVQLPDGVDYDTNLARLETTGILVDLIVRD